MSTLLRLIRCHEIKSKVTFLRPKDTKICNKARRSDAPTTKSEKDQSYKIEKPWSSYGFDYENQKTDRQIMHVTFFTAISICLVFGAVGIGYLPDPLLKDWSQREAYLQLRYREENGLPLIDPNLIDPSKVILPSDEELAHADIII